MSILFHGSFGLYRDRLSSILRSSLANPDHDDQQLAEPLGYGAPFASKYRSWLHKTGLTCQKLPLHLTDFGKVVFENDPRLESIASAAFLHWQLSETDRAFAWNFFVNDFLPRYETFSREQLISELASTIDSRSLGAGSPQKMASAISRKLIECYSEDYSLGKLGLLRKENGGYLHVDGVRIPGPWKTPQELQQAYSD